jgi:hypothetical protein
MSSLRFWQNCGVAALTLLLLAGAWGMGAADAEDWPQIGGPQRDNTSTETGLADHWPEGGPRVAWERKGLGGGFSNPIVSAGRVFVRGRQAVGKLGTWNVQQCAPDPDVLWCLDQSTGKVLWKVEFPLHMESESSTAWSTPASDGVSVFARGGDGEVRCLDAKDDKLRWSWPKDQKLLVKQNAKELSVYAGGLALLGDWVLLQGLAPGRNKDTLIAADKKTGEVVWEVPLRSWLFGARNPFLLEVQGKKLLAIAGQFLEFSSGKKVGECPMDDWWFGRRGDQLYVGFVRDLKPKEKPAAPKQGREIFERESGLQCLALAWNDDGTVNAQQRWQWLVRTPSDREAEGTVAASLTRTIGQPKAGSLNANSAEPSFGSGGLR